MAADTPHSHDKAARLGTVRDATARARARDHPDRKGICRSRPRSTDHRDLSKPRSARISARASSPAPGRSRFKQPCWRMRPRRSVRSATSSRVGEHLIAVENTPKRHNMVVCTLCSCYPWEVLGLPPVWYKSSPYRSRAVIDPSGVLADFGVTLPPETEIRVWDSPPRPAFWCCRCGPRAPKAGARRSLLSW